MSIPTPPIFIIEDLDIGVFASEKAALLQLEPWYVEEKEGLVYDSEGRLLNLAVVKEKVPILFGLFHIDEKRIVIRDVDDNPTHKDVFRNALIDHLNAINKTNKTFQELTLNQLVQEVIKINKVRK